MKIHLLLTLAGFAISLASPTFAQQKDTVDPQIIEQLVAIGKKYAEAVNNNDAAAVAALYTEDAVDVGDTGPIYGREAIQKHWADAFQKMHFSNHFNKRDEYFPHAIGTDGNVMWGKVNFPSRAPSPYPDNEKEFRESYHLSFYHRFSSDFRNSSSE
jgi:hypothetical protein